MIKALSVARPWAQFIIGAGKSIENRSWSTSYRGALLIHASKRFDPSAKDFARDILGPAAVRQFVGEGACGFLGVVQLVGICNSRSGCECGPWAMEAGAHWRLQDPLSFPEPLPGKGTLGLFNPPAEVAAAARRLVGAR
jgi:hypothetical protein